MAAITASCAVAPSRRLARPALSQQQPQRAAVRLTRRGRLVVSLGLLVALLAVVTGAVALLLGPGATPAAAGATAQHPSAVTYVVQPGQTLWSIAERVAPTVDPREEITTLREANGLTSSSVFAGQRLLIPVLN